MQQLIFLQTVTRVIFSLHPCQQPVLWVTASFYTPVGYLHVFFEKMSIQVFCSFKKMVYFLQSSYMSSLYILDSPLLDM